MSERAFPPSGQMIMAYGGCANDMPRETLLQIIELIMLEHPFGWEAAEGELASKRAALVGECRRWALDTPAQIG